MELPELKLSLSSTGIHMAVSALSAVIWSSPGEILFHVVMALELTRCAGATMPQPRCHVNSCPYRPHQPFRSCPWAVRTNRQPGKSLADAVKLYKAESFYREHQGHQTARCSTDSTQGCFRTGAGSASVSTQKHISEPSLLSQGHKILLLVFKSKDNRSMGCHGLIFSAPQTTLSTW